MSGGEQPELPGRILAAAGEAVIATDAVGTIVFTNPAADALIAWTVPPLGRALPAIMPTSWAGDTGAEIFAGVAAGQPYTGELDIRRDGHDPIRLLVKVTPIYDDHGALTGTVCVATDIQDRVRAEDEARRRAAHVAAVAAVGELAVTQPSLRVLFDGAVAESARALEVDIGVLLLPDGDALRVEAAIGLPPGVVGRHRVPVDPKTLAAFLLEHDDIAVMGSFGDSMGQFPPPQLLVDAGAVSGATAALRIAGTSSGLLGVCAREERTFDADDLAVLRTVANVLAHAIERDQANQQLSRIAISDELTGLANRVLFVDRLHHTLTQRPHHSICVSVGDLDQFKDVNDALGHSAGDALLRATAERLTSAVRPGDTVARFGGDEFAVLTQGISGPEEAVAVARRLADAVAAEPIEVDGREIHVSMSVGVVVPDRADVAPEVLLRDADAAMYRAKAAGRGRVELFDEHLRASVVERLDLTNQLIAGLSAGELVVHYQPEIGLHGDEVWAEALVRWQHPERGLVMPADFIDLAEETGLIVPLGRVVLREVVEQLARWAAMPAGHAPSAVSVNLSARQLVDGDLVALTADLLQRLRVDPRTLWFELTETAVMRDPDQSIALLHDLKALGVGLAIDDFGTGYSSLTYARTLPIDALKIDRSFISGMGEDLRDEGIVRATIGLAHSFGILAIAEGVETEEQLANLRDLGCDFAQGYLIARPGPTREVEGWMRTRQGAAGPDQ